MFVSDILELKQDIFKELSTNIQFENITKGRQTAILIEKDKYKYKNIVRTTSNYNIIYHKYIMIY
jgi:hypothetical protein